MIFVVLGTQKFQCNRLLQILDGLIEEGIITEKILAQIGHSDYKPSHYVYTDFLDKEAFEQHIANCSLLITHSGVGTILSGINYGKPVIVFPRLQKYQEHVDNHQLEIAEAFSKKNYVLCCGDNENLGELIAKCQNHKFARYHSKRQKTVDTVSKFLQKPKTRINKRKNVKRAKRNVLMCCSDLAVKGGMVSVVRSYLDQTSWGNITIIYVPTHVEKGKITKSLYFIKAYMKILYLCAFHKIDLVHLHASERGSVFRKAMITGLCHRFGLKVILHHHGAEFEGFYSELNTLNKRRISSFLESVDLNIVLSKRLIPMIKDKAPDAKIEVLYNAVPVHPQNPYNKQASNILFLGRLGKRKGTYDLLEAVKRIDSEIPETIQFYFCGDGEIDEVKAKIKEDNLSHRIAYVGWIDNNQKEEIFFHTSINVLPSYHEGLPMTILETMAYGIPNISTNIASIPEVLVDEGNGFLIEPGDISRLCEKLKLLISKRELRVEFSNKSYELVMNQFNIDQNINKLKKIYTNLSQ